MYYAIPNILFIVNLQFCRAFVTRHGVCITNWIYLTLKEIVTTSNYSALTNSRPRLLTTAHTNSRCYVTAPNNEVPSASVFTSILAGDSQSYHCTRSPSRDQKSELSNRKQKHNVILNYCRDFRDL
jgi:hypothetical protein